MTPIPGKQYTVQTGDDFESIAIQAYGNPKRARTVADANQGTIKNDDWKFVQAGTKIIIPVVGELEELRELQRL